MTDPTITYPSCKAEIKLTESLAAPLIETTRREFEQKLAQKEADIATREAALKIEGLDMKMLETTDDSESA